MNFRDHVAAAGAVSAVPDRATFREAMSRVGGAVHVVTTGGPAGPGGFTATAVLSVSDTPPTLIACLNRANSAAEAFRANRVMAINTLAADQAVLAEVFAGRTAAHGAGKFQAAGEWRIGATGAALLAGALAVFECDIIGIEDVATHQVMVGEARAIVLGADKPGLIYRGRAYHAL